MLDEALGSAHARLGYVGPRDPTARFRVRVGVDTQLLLIAVTVVHAHLLALVALNSRASLVSIVTRLDVCQVLARLVK